MSESDTELQQLKAAIAKQYADSHTPWPETIALDWPDVFADKIMLLLSDYSKRERVDEIKELVIASGSYAQDRSYSRDETGFYVVDKTDVADRIATLTKSEDKADE